MSSTFAPSLTAEIIFRRVGFHDRYRKRVLHLLIEEKKKKLVKVQGCSHKRNARRESPLDHRAINLLIHLTRNWRAAAENTNWTHRYPKLNLRLATRKRLKKKKNNHTALGFLDFPYNRAVLCYKRLFTKACMGCKRCFLKARKNIMFLNKIDSPYCLVVFFVVCPRLRPF